jgi:hypothetical protein
MELGFADEASSLEIRSFGADFARIPKVSRLYLKEAYRNVGWNGWVNRVLQFAISIYSS